MANHVRIANLATHLGEEVVIKGWLYNARSSGKILFLEIRDGSGIVQGIVAKNAVSEEVWERAESLTQESSIIVTGTPREHPKRPGVYELDVRDLTIVQLTMTIPSRPRSTASSF